MNRYEKYDFIHLKRKKRFLSFVSLNVYQLVYYLFSFSKQINLILFYYEF